MSQRFIENNITMEEKHCRAVMHKLWLQKQSQHFCDVILCADDGQVWAHKSIVSANSTSFDLELLRPNITVNEVGNKPHKISLLGCSTAIVQTVVEFMYTGKAQLTTDNLVKCMSFAHQHCMSLLQRECVEFAKHNISSSNWISLMKFAISSDSIDLNTILTDYVTGVADELILLEEFLLLPIDFITYILSPRAKENLNENGEMQLFKLAVSWVSFSSCERMTHLRELLCSLCVTRLRYYVTKQFIDVSTQLSEEIRTEAELVEWLKMLEANESGEDYVVNDVGVGDDDNAIIDYAGDTDCDDDCDDNDTAQLATDDSEYFVEGELAQRKTRTGSAKQQRLNKRKLSIPVRYEDGECGSARPLLMATVGIGRTRGRPRNNPVTNLRTNVLVQPNPTSLAMLRNEDEGNVAVTRVEVNEEPGAEEVNTTKTPRKSRTARTVDPNTEKIQCPRCPRAFNVALTFRVHLRGHGITEPWVCDKCSFETKHYGMFLSHMRRKHKEGDARVKCPKCPKTFSSESACNYHVRGHGSEQPMLCDICGFTTKHYASMNLHKRMHAGNVFKCPYEGCSYTEARKNRYLDHISGHQGVKNHICTVCGKGFGARKHLLRHENTHNEQKAIKCDICEYTSSRQDKIRQHLKIHHPKVALERGYVTQEWAAKQEVNLASIAARLTGNKQPKRGKKRESGTAGKAGVVTAVPQQMDGIRNVSDSVALNEETPSAPSAITTTSTMPQSQTEAGCDPAGRAFIDVMVREEASRAVRAITLTSSVTSSADDTGVMQEGQLVASPGGTSVHSVQDVGIDLNNKTTQNAADIQINAPNIMNSPDPTSNTQNEPSVPSGDVHSTQRVHNVSLPVGLHQVALPAGAASTISEEMLHYVYATQQHVWGQYQQAYPTVQQDVNESK